MLVTGETLGQRTESEFAIASLVAQPKMKKSGMAMRGHQLVFRLVSELVVIIG